MDSDNLVAIEGLEVAHQNGLNEQPIIPEEDDFFPVNVNGNVEKVMVTDTDIQNGNLECISAGELKEGSNDFAQSNGLTVSKEGVKGADNRKKSKPHKVQDNSKNEKHLGSNNDSSSLVKKSNDGKRAEATSTASNGSVTRSSLQKQPHKSQSINDRQAAKQSEKLDVAYPEGLEEKTRLKPLRKEPLDEAEGVPHSFPKAEDGKPRRMGALPNYGFSFKCDERAEKRKEFYSKLEEKTNARELEKSNLQAKSKETQEAEIKMLRKSLNFKATPIPSFYQEPPPKVELKKIPPTRAKSPKLGRRKSTTPADSEGNISNSCPSGRLSLDEMTCQSNSTKGISPVQSKKPQRMSLPKLPSEKTRLSSATKQGKTTPSKAKSEVKAASSKAANEGKTKSEENADSTNEENSALSGVTDEGACAIQEQEPLVSTAVM
ncbi:hypothetical protein SLE2022_186190 [Rubroshorea leprosula]